MGEGEVEFLEDRLLRGPKLVGPGTAPAAGICARASALALLKPGIALAVALAGMAGMVLAARALPPMGKAVACVGSTVAAACGAAILNGVFDAPSDARMPRLVARVAALRAVGTARALFLAALLVGAGLAAAARFLNPEAALLIAAAVACYAGLYTLYFKRRSPYGTVPGGIPGALPVLVGYAAVSPRLGADGILLFLVMLLWQPPHFWTLALRCRDEYREAGLPVLPVVRGEPYTKAAIFIYAVALLPLSMGLWIAGPCSGRFAAAAAALWIYFIYSLYFHAVRAPRFGQAFRASILYILGLLLAVILDLAL